MYGHLPEPGGQVHGCEQGQSVPSNVPDALVDLLYGVLVDVGVRVEGPEILHNSMSLTLFLRDATDG